MLERPDLLLGGSRSGTKAGLSMCVSGSVYIYLYVYKKCMCVCVCVYFTMLSYKLYGLGMN